MVHRGDKDCSQHRDGLVSGDHHHRASAVSSPSSRIKDHVEGMSHRLSPGSELLVLDHQLGPSPLERIKKRHPGGLDITHVPRDQGQIMNQRSRSQ